MLNAIPVVLGLFALQVAAIAHPKEVVIPNGYRMTEADEAAWKASFQPNGRAFQRPDNMPIIELKPGQTLIMGNSSCKSGPQKRSGANQVNLYSDSGCSPDKWFNTFKNFGCDSACIKLSVQGFSAWVWEESKGKPTPDIALYANEECTGDYTHADDDGGADITRCTETQTHGFMSLIIKQC